MGNRIRNILAASLVGVVLAGTPNIANSQQLLVRNYPSDTIPNLDARYIGRKIIPKDVLFLRHKNKEDIEATIRYTLIDRYIEQVEIGSENYRIMEDVHRGKIHMIVNQNCEVKKVTVFDDRMPSKEIRIKEGDSFYEKLCDRANELIYLKERGISNQEELDDFQNRVKELSDLLEVVIEGVYGESI